MWSRYDRAVWGRLVLAGILQQRSILFSFNTDDGYDGPHKELGRVLGYLIGDILGISLFVVMLISIDTVRELRKDPVDERKSENSK